jgi:hypothetical protein
MDTDKRRIPRKDKDLNDFIRTTTQALQDVATRQRLGMLDAEWIIWQQLHHEWVAVYPLVTGAQRSKLVVLKKDDIRKRFTKQTFKPLYRAQVMSTVTEDDRLIFRIAKRKSTRTKPPKIETAPWPQFENIGGGWLRLRVRVEGTEGRPRMHPHAHVLLVRYAVLPFDAPAPATSEACNGISYLTKALSIMKFEPVDRGKKVYAFLRWLNTSDNSKSGPWSNRIEAVLA